MAGKAFSQIKEAEMQAQALIKSAQEEAAQIIKRAEQDTEEAFLKVSETYKRQILDKKRQVEMIAKTNSSRFSKETEVACVELKQKLLSQKTKAIYSIIQMITDSTS